jgi:uncharacterized repeat protein (TIGR01451 family)
MNALKIIAQTFLLLMVSTFSLFGQGWERTYQDLGIANGGVDKIIPMADGGYLFTVWENFGSFNENYDALLVKTNADGYVQSKFRFDHSIYDNPIDFIPTSDGGFLLLYESYDTLNLTPRLAKLDAQFNVIFDVTTDIFNSSIFRANRILETSAGYFVLSGSFVNEVLYKYDVSGNLMTTTPFGASSFQSEAFIATNDGNLLVLGNKNLLGGPTMVIYKIDVNSQTVEEHIVSSPSDPDYEYVYGRNIIAAIDGGFLIAGVKAGQFGGEHLRKLDAQLNLQWKKTFLNTQVLVCKDVVSASDGSGYFLSSVIYNSPGLLFVKKINFDGNLIWDKQFTTYPTYSKSDIAATTSGGCVIGGTRFTKFSSLGNGYLPYLFKIDSLGNTFLSGISGTATEDLNGDCQTDRDTSFYKKTVYAWKNGIIMGSDEVGQNGDWHIATDTGIYVCNIQAPNAAWSFCPNPLMVSVLQNDTTDNADLTGYYNPQPLDSIIGYVFEDTDGDCFKDSFEIGYPNWNIKTQFSYQNFPDLNTTSNADGYFVFKNIQGVNNEYIDATLSATEPTGDGLFCHIVCADTALVLQNGETVAHGAFGVRCDVLPSCPIIDVDIASSTFRPCFSATYHIHYCNRGGVDANPVSIAVTFDSVMQVVNASIPWISVVGNTYLFEIGYLGSELCGDFTIETFLPCEEPTGKTYCATAHAYPDTSCAPTGANWDGAIITLTGTCEDSSAVFNLENIGTGNMQQTLEYIVIEDNVLREQSTFQLNAGQTKTLYYPADGAFWRVEAMQSPDYPANANLASWVEGCNTGSSNQGSQGFVNQFPLGDEDPWIDVFCLQSVNSYDPNDKTGFPIGVSDEHYIKPNTDIEYLIRFQNTGTAEAINIEIRDTIPVQFLNPTTVRAGASSHPYHFDMQGNGVVTFKFENINLPDSSTNWVASQGFVKFRVSQREGLPLGTRIENDAAIFFDFNAPIITNQTWHTLGEDFLVENEKNNDAPLLLEVETIPNPIGSNAIVHIKKSINNIENLYFELYNVQGIAIQNGVFVGNNYELEGSNLSKGVYFFEVKNGEGVILSRGKLVKM